MPITASGIMSNRLFAITGDLTDVQTNRNNRYSRTGDHDGQSGAGYVGIHGVGTGDQN